VATFEAVIGGDFRIDHGCLISVNLPRANEFPISHPKRLPRLPVCLVEVLQHNILVVRQSNFRNPTHKTVLAPKMLQCRKGSERQLAIFQRNYYLWFGSA